MSRVDWQSLISKTATEQFARTGRLLDFKLARGDLVDLCAQVARQEPGIIWDQLKEGHGFSRVRCLVRCEPLDRAIVVDEWV